MGGTLRIPNFTILSMRYIKLAQNTTAAKILAFIGIELVSRQISATAATACDRRIFFIALSVLVIELE
jgi:hypothetical protein